MRSRAPLLGNMAEFLESIDMVCCRKTKQELYETMEQKKRGKKHISEMNGNIFKVQHENPAISWKDSRLELESPTRRWGANSSSQLSMRKLDWSHSRLPPVIKLISRLSLPLMTHNYLHYTYYYVC